VAEWLSSAGVTLFFAGSAYAVVRTSVVESWPRVTSKRIRTDVRAVAQGTFDFATLEDLLERFRFRRNHTKERALRCKSCTGSVKVGIALAVPNQDEGEDEA
jgi:hypothetical protein